MKKRIATIVATLLLLGVGWLFFYEPAYRPKQWGSQRPLPQPRVFAHRGFGNHAPDNSLAGVELAMRAGADGVDMDGQLSSDGVLVIFHDLSVDRLTEGTGRVTAKAFAELRQLDLGRKYGGGFAGQPGSFVADMETFLRTTQGRGTLMVELKTTGIRATGIEERAVEVIRAHQAFDDVLISSFNPVVLARIKRLEPRIKTVFIFMDTNWNPHLLAEIKPGDRIDLPFFLRHEPFRRALRKWIEPDYLSVNVDVAPETIRRLIARGYPIFLWAPQTRPAIEAALRLRPYGVISDEPLEARAIREWIASGH